MTELQQAVQRIRKRLAAYEAGLRAKAFEVGDNPISDEHAEDLRVVIAAVEAQHD